MRRLPFVTLVLLGACVLPPNDQEGSGGQAIEAPTILHLRGALSDGIELVAHVIVTPRSFDCDVADEPADLADLGTLDTLVARDLVVRTRVEGGRYELDVPLRWSVGACSLQAFSVSLHAFPALPTPRSASEVVDSFGRQVLSIGRPLSDSAPIEEIGALSCRPDPFSSTRLACRRADGRIEARGDAHTGLAFFHALTSDPAATDVTVELSVLEHRQSCAAAACTPGCDPSQRQCLPVECDEARDCELSWTGVRQREPMAIAPGGTGVGTSELWIDGAETAPAALADVVLALDYLTPERLAIAVYHDGALVAQVRPSRTDDSRTELRIPLGDAAARDPSGTWALQVAQLDPFFHGSVAWWGIDLYR